MLSGLLLLSALFCTVVSAQTQVPGTEAMLDRMRQNKLKQVTSGNNYVEINGVGYLYPEFTDGYLRTLDGQFFRGKFRYDMYAEIPEFIAGEYVYQLSAPMVVDTVGIGEYKFIYVPEMEADVPGKSTFFVLLEDGPFQLLRRPSVILRDPEPAKLYQDAKPAQFLPISDSYYIRENGKPAVRIKSKQSILDALKDSGKDMGAFIKQNKISTNDPEDLLRVVGYCNSR
ncbi:MAG: hypothetical protein ACOYXB_04755 [Bacteroidota bacterium]